MFTPEYARVMALYNRWQNERLYALCADLSDADRTGDRGLFFGSILNTLNHILVVDRVLLRMALDGTVTPLETRAVPHPRFEDLRAERERFDASLVALADEHDAAWFAESVVFYSERLGRDRRPPRAYLLGQLYNHQTHHRSQVTSELHRMGIDYGITDIPYNPYIAF
jgi:uncharacterized damage-inducible protein DinB